MIVGTKLVDEELHEREFLLSLLEMLINACSFKKIVTGYFFHYEVNCNICGALRELVPFVQFKKREKYPWRSVTFSKVAC